MRQPRKITSRTIRLPDVTGIELENGRLMLRNAGFAMPNVRWRYEEAYHPEGQIIRQEPSSGALIGVDEQVELVVSRRSLLHMLPQVYQKADGHNQHFLRDFLWIFDHMFADIQGHLGRIHQYFDPLESPKDYLAWLADWVALAIDQDWPETKKRELIQQAIGIYGYRGTVRGLKLFMSIFTDVEPVITENEWPYRGFRVGFTQIGIDSIVLPPVNLAHCFMVEVPAEFTDATDETILKIHDIIRMEKPAHTAYYLTFAAAAAEEDLVGFRVGFGRLGVGTSGVVADARTAETTSEEEPKGKTE